MSDTSDDMEFYSGFIDDFSEDDLESKIDKVLLYCRPYIDQMWAAKIVGILTDTDFRDAKETLNEYFGDE